GLGRRGLQPPGGPELRASQLTLRQQVPPVFVRFVEVDADKHNVAARKLLQQVLLINQVVEAGATGRFPEI
nr:hypothetical protein [Tanacetum cinerariifolium]